MSATISESTWQSSPMIPFFSYLLKLGKTDGVVQVITAEDIPQTNQETYNALKHVLSSSSSSLSKKLFNIPQLNKIEPADTNFVSAMVLISEHAVARWATSEWRRHQSSAETVKLLATLGCSFERCREYIDIHGRHSMHIISSRPQTILPFLNNDKIESFIFRKEHIRHQKTLLLLTMLMENLTNGKTITCFSEIPPTLLSAVNECTNEKWITSDNYHIQLASSALTEKKIRDFLTQHSRAFHPRYSSNEINQAVFRWETLAFRSFPFLDHGVYSDLLNHKIVIWNALDLQNSAKLIESFKAIYDLVAKTQLRIIALSEHIYSDVNLKGLSIPIARAGDVSTVNFSTSIILGAEAATPLQLFHLLKSTTPNTQLIFVIHTPSSFTSGSLLGHLSSYYPNTTPPELASDFTLNTSTPIEHLLSKISLDDDALFVTDNYKISAIINNLHRPKNAIEILKVSGEPYYKDNLVYIEFTSGRLTGSVIHGRLCSVSKKGILIDHHGQYHLITEHDALKAKWSNGYCLHISNIPRLRLKKFRLLISANTSDKLALGYVQRLLYEHENSSIEWYTPDSSTLDSGPRCQRISPIIE